MKDTRRVFRLTRKIVFMYVITISPMSCFLQPLSQSSTSGTHPSPSEYHRRRAIAPSSRSSTRPFLGPISERFRGSHPNTDESTKLQEIPTPDHEPAIIEVPQAHDKQVCFPSVL